MIAEIQIEEKTLPPRRTILIDGERWKGKILPWSRWHYTVLLIPLRHECCMPYLTERLRPDIAALTGLDGDFREHEDMIKAVHRRGKGRELFLIMTGRVRRGRKKPGQGDG